MIAGDSIAYGRCDPRGGWAGRLAARHIAANERDHRVFNLAVPGSTLAEVAEQTPALLAARRPDTLLIAAGINDSAVPASAPHEGSDGLAARLADSLASLAATARDHNARLAVLGPLWLDESRTADYEGLRFTESRALVVREALRTWCAEHHVDHVDLWTPLQHRADLLTDGIHPGPEGHETLYRHLTA